MRDVREIYRELKGRLLAAGVGDPAFDADVLLRCAAGRGHLELDALSDIQERRLWELAERRQRREPLQYIAGKWPFLGLELLVGEGVLIPRPETEEVCLAAARYIEGLRDPVVLDLCSGSGALALGLQSLVPAARVTAVEWDGAAFAWLRRNLRAFEDAGAPRAPLAVRADALSYAERLRGGSVDLVVCNPPYVTEEEYGGLEAELYYEPRAALVPLGGEADGLLFYRHIAREYAGKLKTGGAVVFEVGHTQGEVVCGILRENGYGGVSLGRDAQGKGRIAAAVRVYP